MEAEHIFWFIVSIVLLIVVFACGMDTSKDGDE